MPLKLPTPLSDLLIPQYADTLTACRDWLVQNPDHDWIATALMTRMDTSNQADAPANHGDILTLFAALGFLAAKRDGLPSH